MGRGNASIRIDARNLKTGAIEQKSFNSGARVEAAPTTKRRMQYLYSDGSNAMFMDPTTYEQVEVPTDTLGEQLRFLKDGETVNLLFWSFGGAQDIPLLIELVPNVTLKVKDTGPGVKGNSATNIWKPATLENGLQVKVPLFIGVGDSVRVDTRTGEYIERAK